MGLDMYLSAEKYVGGWEHAPEAERASYRTIVSAIGLPDNFHAEGSPHLEVNLCVCYWRKANQIHNWFVQNVQGGADECQKAYVSREQLTQLRDLCREVIIDPSAAEKLLPTASGFFFGGTDYDQFYLADIKHTEKTLSALLQNPLFESWDFYYRSSW